MTLWQRRRVTVTGGASFIGSHLTEALVAAGATVRVADDFSSGTRENLRTVEGDVEIVETDLRHREQARSACDGAEVVFHLAATHGGRGFIDLRQAACAENFALDQSVFNAALDAGADKVVFTSSACVYPEHLQQDLGRPVRLEEGMVGPPFSPDGLYGLAKLAAELTLGRLWSEEGLPSAVCRLFTVYGPRERESHALMAMIARAFTGEDPFRIWGTGDQVRSWLHVDDVVRALLLASEHVDDATPVNVGTSEPRTVRHAAETVLRVTGHTAKIVTQPDMPTGPLNRVADTRRAEELLGFSATTPFEQGLRTTAQWYFETRERASVARALPDLLLERAPAAAAAGREA